MKAPWIQVMAMVAALSHLLMAQASSDVVLIDHGHAAYTVYAGLPNERAEALKGKIANEPALLVTFDEFSADCTKYIAAYIVSNDYAGSRAVEGIVELVKKYPGTPFAITWNGGIAFTRNDYQFAKQQFTLYRTDPEEYRRTRGTNPATDPVNPTGHLRPLLGW